MSQHLVNKKEIGLVVGWNKETLAKRGTKQIIVKLESMGLEDVQAIGKAGFLFTTPRDFWKVLQIPTVEYSPITVDCLNAIIKCNVERNGFILFDTEIVAKIAAKHCVPAKTVQSKYTKIKGYLEKHGLAYYQREKMWRVKKNGAYTTGVEAVRLSKRVVGMWNNFYEINENPSDRDRRKVMEDMKIKLGAEDIRRVQGFKVTNEFLKGIKWAERTFDKEKDLSKIKQVLAEKHKQFKLELEYLIEERKAYLARKQEQLNQSVTENQVQTNDTVYFKLDFNPERFTEIGWDEMPFSGNLDDIL